MDLHHETDARPTDCPHPEPEGDSETRDHTEDSVWRRFMSLYDSLQWHMYL